MKCNVFLCIHPKFGDDYLTGGVKYDDDDDDDDEAKEPILERRMIGLMEQKRKFASKRGMPGRY